MNSDQQALPFVSVVLPAYNSGSFIESAIRSILEQSYDHFELLVVVDESSDDTLAIATRMAALDPRVKVLNNRFSKSISGALNTGLLAARGQYLARMDADDLAVPDRLEKQVNYLEVHPEISVLGTAFEVFNASGPRLTVRHPTNPIFCALFMSANTVIGHPTVMMRRPEAFEAGGYYSEQAAEDYGLFSRISQRWQISNLDFVGIRYREHGNNASLVQQAKVDASARSIGHYHYQQLGGFVQLHELLRVFLQNPKAVGIVGRIVGGALAIHLCFKIAKVYSIKTWSPEFRAAMKDVSSLVAGKAFHG